MPTTPPRAAQVSQLHVGNPSHCGSFRACDTILAISDQLDRRMGGSGFDLFEPNTNYVRVYNSKQEFSSTDFRRMVYQNKPRLQLDDTFGAFDCQDLRKAP